ncbi:MAG: anthranilate phosphoribosyltransferase [Saprospiraceae bacterium]|nr:anthranilate phosphoribosyltransferase [Saprospiraceae bacterium]
MQKILEDLFQHRKLSRQEAHDLLVEISKGQYSDVHLACFLSVFKMRPITVEELQGFRDALLRLCNPIDLGGIDSIDIVGTGGDSKNTFNISTLASFIVAGAGYKVTKHGNYGVSSVSGSSNVLEHLGYAFTKDPDDLMRRLDTCGICFFHAPLFHPAMKALGPVRRAMGMKTFFNMLGPLVNPARPKRHFLGVFNLNLARLYHYILQAEEQPFGVVYSLDGYDEISLTSTFSLKTNDADLYLTPEDIGMQRVRPEELYGGHDVIEAAKIFTTILAGDGSKAQNEVVEVNAGAAIQIFHPERSLVECIDIAKESLQSGRAMACLKKAVEA